MIKNSSNQKYFIDNVNRIRQCGNCFQIKDFSEFCVETKTGRPKTSCKKCLCKIVYRRKLEKILIAFPNQYIECDNCDHIYRKANKQCRKCTNIKFKYREAIDE